MSHRKNNPFELSISLYPKQAEVLASPANEILYGGAAGGGKSHLLRSAAIIWCCQIPGIQILLLRRTFVDLAANHLEGPSSIPAILAPYIKSGMVVWNKSDNSFTFWNGARIKLGHCQRESDRFNYQGQEIHVLLVDELAHFTPLIYRFLRTRVRMVGVDVPEGVVGSFPKIVCATNPGGPCHNFMKMNWVDAAPPMKVWKASDEDGGMYRQFIPAKLTDNPSLMDNDPAYVQRLMGLGDPALVKAYLEGDFSIVSGGMFDDVWVRDVHVIEPFSIPSSWYIDRAFDMGSSKPFSIGWFAESDGTEAVMPDGTTRNFPKGTIFQIGEWYGWNGEPDVGLRLTPTEIASGVKHIESKIDTKVYPGPADNSIFDSESNGKSPSDEMEKLGVRWTRSDKSPGSRVAGWTKIRSMMKNSLSSRPEYPCLYFFNNCVNTIRTLPVAVRSKNNPDDVDTSIEDHALDMLRYRVLGGKIRANLSNFRAF